MRITPELLVHLENLARIELSEAEREAMREDLEKILAYFEKLGELKLEGLEELARPVETGAAMREDVPEPGLSQEEALQNAPEREDGYFKVPRMIENE